jgi:phytoene synthase
MLEPVSRACVACAFTLYRGILDEIEAAGYDVLHRRVAVPNRRRAAVAVPGLARAMLARLQLATDRHVATGRRPVGVIRRDEIRSTGRRAR